MVELKRAIKSPTDVDAGADFNTLTHANSFSLSLSVYLQYSSNSQPKTLCFVLVDCGSIEHIMRRCKDATQHTAVSY